MPGIQISGLLANSAFDWKSVVDQLIAVSGTPIKKLNAEKDLNTAKAAALENLGTVLTDLKDAMQAIRADETFSARTVSSDLANTTWKSSSVTGAALGSYAFDVTQLATKSQARGASDIGSGLATSSDVSGLTMANLATAAAVTAGTFTVDGQQVTVALTDSLQDVFDAIATATGGSVTAGYDHTTDRVTLTKGSGELVLGAANDTSNFLAVMKLANSGGAVAASSAALGTVQVSAPLGSAGLRSAITAVDGAGDGSFAINGVAIAYNVNTDTLGALITRINDAGAGVTAVYDSTKDRVVLTNKSTGDVGIAITEAAGGIVDALGLSTAGGGSLLRGQNAEFTVNGGDVLTSSSNTLDAAVHGITGLSVTVNTETLQTLQVESDTLAMQEAIEDFIAKFNAAQDFIEETTKVTVSGGVVSTAVLSDNREVQAWARQLRSLAFDVVGGVTGDISRLDHLGIDFDSTTSHLRVKDAGKFATALGDRPEDVGSLFLTPTTGLIGRFYDFLGTITSAGRQQQSRLGAQNTDLDEQIATLQARLETEREQLTNAFIRMLEAQSTAQSQNTYLTNMFFKDNSS
jgi:flagellar hook-associated protein 2